MGLAAAEEVLSNLEESIRKISEMSSFVTPSHSNTILYFSKIVFGQSLVEV